MRQKHIGKAKGISSKGNHGYALTSRKAVKNILRGLPIQVDDSFLDIGCGKGGVLCFATEFPFGRIAGIEIESRLVGIAKRNLEILHLQSRVEVIQADALTFEHYSEFNFFFLFNPFDLEIYGEVLVRIFRCIEAQGPDDDSTTWLLCYGESNVEAIWRSNLFELYRSEVCPYRGNSLRIWKSKKRVVSSSGGKRTAASFGELSI
jgi:SAM-dependent methyltransferase